MQKPASKDIAELSVLMTQLIDVLAEERRCLTSRDSDQLQHCVSRKEALCQQINAKLKADESLLSSLSAPAETTGTPADLAPDHKKLIELAVTARDSNLVNGKILHRTQQSVREILGILSGTSLDGLYGQSGEQTGAGSSTSRSGVYA